MKAPDGALVNLTLDLPNTVMPGDLIRTTTGRLYEVVDAYRMRSKYPDRQRVSAVVIGAPDPHRCDDRVRFTHVIRWYKRG